MIQSRNPVTGSVLIYPSNAKTNPCDQRLGLYTQI